MSKKAASCLLSLLLIGTLFGCSSENKNETSVPATTSSPSATSQGQASAEAKPPITLKISAFVSKAEPNGVGQNPVAKYIEEKLGITMNMTSVGGGDDWPQKLNALIASNDLPDIFLVTDPVKQIPQMIKAKQIVELGPLLEKNGKNILSHNLGKAMVELQTKYSPSGDKLYSIGMNMGTWDTGTAPIAGHFIRWDLYKKLGYPKLENYDTDLLNVLKQMQEAEPTTKDGKKVYALGGWFADAQGWGDWGITYPLSFSEGQSYVTLDKTVVADIETNTVNPNNALTDKNSIFWRAIKFYNKANQMGILDPESFSQKSDGYVAKMNTGRYLYESEGWYVDGINNFFEKEGTPEKGMVALPALGTDKYTLINMLPAGERTYVISSKCKDPERALELLDFLSSYEASRIVWNGLEGTNWNMEDGKPVPTDDFLNQDGNDFEFMKKTGALIYQHFVGFASGTIDPATDTPVNLFANSEKAIAKKLKPVHQDMLEHYGAKSLFDLYTSNMKAYKSNALFSLGELPDDLKTYETNLQAYTFKQQFPLILAKDDAEFNKMQDEFIAGLKEFKVDEIFAYWKSKADQSAQELAPIYDLLK
ncbi:extracellular solute-binding protein [Cohnella herbarum]|uniref:Extracellular solute-binding protein n=1 Tax=Cohnella herbarum TaxID=2728023 RepID=A0A7Z2ZNJ6_9BACL|nr:extracellular solute-binding protein [Cohnella herbarum]QJD86273.1 extracellular solute-binding protein [Cohnella herbarum]